jgi:DNA-directed RNA polymerase specialized sigma24 family protein
MTQAIHIQQRADALNRWLHQRNWLTLFEETEHFAYTTAEAVLAQDASASDMAIRREALRQLSVALHQQCQSESEGAQKRAFDVLGQYVLGLLAATDLADDIAHDIAQQALLEIHRSLHNATSPDAFLGYCKKIAQRVAWKAQQRRRTEAQALSLDEPLSDQTHKTLADVVADPTDVAETAIYRLLGFQQVLTSDKLTAHERKILIWHFRHEVSRQDICRALRMTSGSLDVAIHRALRKLRDDPTLLTWQ